MRFRFLLGGTLLLGILTAAIAPPNVVYAPYYGRCTWDASHDVGPCITLAWEAVGTGGTVMLPTGRLGLATGLLIGNGTKSSVSAYNGIKIVGVGHPFERLGIGQLANTGTQLVWIGAAHGIMATIQGPAAGISFQNVAFDANNSADTCIRLLSARHGIYSDIVCANFLGKGLDFTTQPAATGLTDNSQFSTVGNEFINPELWSSNNGAIAVSLDGYTGDGVNVGFDSLSNFFINPKVAISASGSSIGFRFAFSDVNVIQNPLVVAIGANDGTSCAVSFISTTTNPSDGAFFPQTNIFTGGTTDLGQGLGVCVSGAIGPGNKLGNYTLLDGSNIPRDPFSQMLPFDAVETGSFPTGGFWSKGGLNINERSLRNRLINSDFHFATNGTTYTNPANGAETLDLWKVAYDGTQMETISQQTFTPGQTAVPYNPRRYIEFSYSGNVGGTFTRVFQPIESVETFANRTATVSAWMKATNCGAGTVSGLFVQNFGTGGSPSSSVVTLATAIIPPTNWQRVAFSISVPSIASKTIGTNNDDSMQVGWQLPQVVGCVIDIADAQAEYGQIDTAYEIRPDALDKLLLTVVAH